jgi:hypothetical protein
MKVLKALGITLLISAASIGSAVAQSWTPLKNQPSFAAGVALLLTDGTVLVQDAGAQDWWKLTPDSHANYVNGTWKQVASLPSNYSPLYFGSAVLPDGRVIVEGGEYNFFSPVWTNLGAIYDPLKDKWTAVNPPSGWANIGDGQSVILTNGSYMQADSINTNDAILDAKTLTWTAVGTGKQDRNDEEGWTLLPDGTVLTVDAINAPNAEKFIPSTGQWISAGNTIVRLEDPNSQEIGPAILRPDGTVLATGATGHNAVYTPPANPQDPGTWVAAPDFPKVNGQQLDIADGPAALLPNGNVLVATSPGVFNNDVHFFEWNGTSFTEVVRTPDAPNETSYQETFLVLPTGQVMMTSQTSDVEIYNPTGSAPRAWAPKITSVPTSLTRGQTYQLSGKGLNGLSAGATYGDDAQMASNYPLIALYNKASKTVTFARTHDHSFMGVRSPKTVSTMFDVPANTPTGASFLLVIANGIRSNPVSVTIQ